MEKFCNVMKYFFATVCVISFIFLSGVNPDDENWFKFLSVGFVVFAVSYGLAAFFRNRHPVVKRVYAIMCCAYVAYVLKFRRNSKEGRIFVKTFTYRYNHNHVNFNKVVSCVFHGYDMNHLKEVRS